MTELELQEAHKHSRANEGEILASSICGCFYCQKKFKPNSIKTFSKEEGTLIRTAHCPFCGVDSVIGTYSDFEITSAFLKEMNEYWFKKNKDI